MLLVTALAGFILLVIGALLFKIDSLYTYITGEGINLRADNTISLTLNISKVLGLASGWIAFILLFVAFSVYFFT